MREETVSFDEAIQLKNSDLQNFFNLFLDCHVASLLAMTENRPTQAMTTRYPH
ncbi:hypothetical protein [Rickettsia hoogstraalii]|uniref:hypothetical protein n=1 Tax=Rickettsia hoogstraalii TaxID=467174 RepID=UPI000AE68122|nr:hypothetical protein [Rickettsia hoogstraalii]